MKRLQEKSNREVICEVILKYMKGLPEPRELPIDIEIKIKFKEGTERHVVPLV